MTRINGSEITSFIGPDTDSPSQFAELACAHSISTYPHLPTHPKREGDPICDRYSLSLYDNRVIACVADGCKFKLLDNGTNRKIKATGELLREKPH